MLKNPDEAKRTLAGVLKLPIEVITLAWPKHDWAQKLDASVIADIQAKADFLYAEGLVRRKVDVTKELVVPLN